MSTGASAGKRSTSEAATLLDALVQALEKAAAYKTDAELPPVAILWPDSGGQWQSAIPLIGQRLPVFTLGDYDPEARTGPAIWIRTALASYEGPDVPVIYLPGIGKEMLRDVGHASERVQTLLYLQYRGALFVQPNGKVWTVAAFLQNEKQGLGLAVDSSEATRLALVNALQPLLARPLDQLGRLPGGIDAEFLNGILNPDMPDLILEWISDASSKRSGLEDARWASFCQDMRGKYRLDPERDGPSEAARMLGTAQEGSFWYPVWARFAANPAAYPGVPAMLRGAKPPDPLQPSLFGSEEPDYRWPQVNEDQESLLRQMLLKLESEKDRVEAGRAVLALDKTHGARRQSVWARLGQSPMATALEPLALLAELVEQSCPAGDVNTIQEYYTTEGWKVDAAALDALRLAGSGEERRAVESTLNAVYRPWLWESAIRFQEAMKSRPPATVPGSLSPPPGTCVVFADGLRFDLAARLSESLRSKGMDADLTAELGPLPGVTASAKPAQSPVADLLTGGSALTVKVAATGSAMNQNTLRKLLTERGWIILTPHETGLPDGQTNAWTELGNIDSYGHSQPRDLPRQVVQELEIIQSRIAGLLSAGWRQVMVVTDHGWLLTPRPMPKTELPQSLTVERKGRCARLTPGANVTIQKVPWCWDPMVEVAMAPGISCFEEGKIYEHGGLSMQECIIPTLVVRPVKAAVAPASFASFEWHGLRCRVQILGGSAGLAVDIRNKAADASSSMATKPSPVDSHGNATLLIADDASEGASAIVVVVDERGQVVAQRATIVGGE